MKNLAREQLYQWGITQKLIANPLAEETRESANVK
jgi:UV DNA damage endonuclease